MTDYLWDKKGEPDPEVERLEQLLSPLAYKGKPPAPPTPPPRRRTHLGWIAAGALAVSALIALLTLRPWRAGPAAPVAGWAATIHGVETRLPVGEWLDTGAESARLQVADIGTADLAPGTRARIVATGPAQHRLQLEHGTISARIHAKARLFQIETPHAVAIDLGCAFILSVDPLGRGILVVTEGSVALADAAHHEVVVHAGSECQLTEHGPGASTPSGKPAPVPVPAPVPAPKGKSTPKHPAHKTITPSTPAAPQVAPAKQPAPAHKTEAPVKLNHDAQRALEQSAQ